MTVLGREQKDAFKSLCGYGRALDGLEFYDPEVQQTNVACAGGLRGVAIQSEGLGIEGDRLVELPEPPSDRRELSEREGESCAVLVQAGDGYCLLDEAPARFGVLVSCEVADAGHVERDHFGARIADRARVAQCGLDQLARVLLVAGQESEPAGAEEGARAGGAWRVGS